MVYSITNVNSSKFVYSNYADWEIVHEWNLESGPVRLIRSGNKFKSEYNVGNGLKESPLEKPGDMSTEEFIEELTLRRHPYIAPDLSVWYLFAEKSKLNSDVTIDEKNWGVTIADLGLSDDRCGTWGGHAVVVIESIDGDGAYHMQRADVVPDKENPKWANIRFWETDANHLRKAKNQHQKEVELPENFPRSKTWRRPSEDVQRMIGQIEKQRAKFLQGNPVIFFNPHGGDSVKTYNCMQWSSRIVSMSNIRLPHRLSDLFIPTPRTDVNPGVGMAAKEAVAAFTFTTPIYAGIGAALGFAVGGPVGAASGAKIGVGLGAVSSTGVFIARSEANRQGYKTPDRYPQFSEQIKKLEEESKDGVLW